MTYTTILTPVMVTNKQTVIEESACSPAAFPTRNVCYEQSLFVQVVNQRVVVTMHLTPYT